MGERALIAAVLWAVPAVTLGQSPAAAPRLDLRLPSLPAPASTATFRVDVTASPGLETVLDATRRELASDPVRRECRTQPSGAMGACVDVLPAITGLVRRAQKALRERHERRIHDDVTAELAAFCSVNDCTTPNEGLLLPR
jgi:hypothetical protein